jgi:hypothetical protein
MAVHLYLKCLLIFYVCISGTIPGVNSDQMKLKIQLGVPQSTQHLLDADRVKSVFP